MANAGETPPGFQALRERVPNAAELRSPEYEEITVRWTAYAGRPDELIPASARASIDRFRPLDARRVDGPPSRQRAPRLSEDQILAIGIDVRGKPITWRLLPDPRVIRAEFPGPSGTLTGTTLYRTEALFLLVLPRRRGIVAVEIHQPTWNGERFELERLGSFELPR